MPDRPFLPAGWFMNRLVNPVTVRLGLAPVLRVRGRRSGTLLSVPFGGPIEVDGIRYLVSGRGETHWVRNLRAAGEAQLRIKRRSERFRPVEVDGAERDRVVAVYRAKLGTRDEHFRRLPDPVDHPVFRVDPIE